MERLSEKIKRLRDGRDLSQEALGKKIGVSRVAVTKWENGQTENIKFVNLIRLCKLFNVSLEELVCNELQEIKKNTTSHSIINQKSAEYMTHDERIVLQGFRDASDDTRENMLTLAKQATDKKNEKLGKKNGKTKPHCA